MDRKKGCPSGCSCGAAALLFVCIVVLWNFAWYTIVSAKLASRFQGKAVPHRKADMAECRYLLGRNYGLNTNELDVADRVERAWARYLVRGYDPTGVLDGAYGFFNRYDCDVEIVAEASGDALTLTFVPLEIGNPGDSLSCSPRADMRQGKTYRIGKDCIASGENAFSFRHVSVSGGYGMGLLISEIVSTITFGEDSMTYDICRSDYGLGFWLIPIARKNESRSHIVLGSMEGP